MIVRHIAAFALTAFVVAYLFLITYTLLPFTAYGALAAGLFLCTRQGVTRSVGAGVLVGGACFLAAIYA